MTVITRAVTSTQAQESATVAAIIILSMTLAACEWIGLQGARVSGAQASAPVVSLPDNALRSAAPKGRLPIYPPASLSKNLTGLAVASVVVGTDGKVEQLEILQAPDSHIDAAVRDAVSTWVFKPIRPAFDSSRQESSIQQWKLKGKLMFYFEIANGQGRVLDPTQMLSLQRGRN